MLSKIKKELKKYSSLERKRPNKARPLPKYLFSVEALPCLKKLIQLKIIDNKYFFC